MIKAISHCRRIWEWATSSLLTLG